MPAALQPSDPSPSDGPHAVLREDGIESAFIGKLQGLKYECRPDITDRASLERNFRAKFEELNRVRLTDADCPARQRPPTTRSHPAESERSDGQFARLLDEIVEYNNDPGNGYTKTLLCFLQLFIVSNRDRTYYFANNNARHFAFNADERFLPVYEFADEDNKKITHLDDFAARFLQKCELGRTISRYMVLIKSPLDLGSKARTHAELALLTDLHPLLTKRAAGRDISGLRAYEQSHDYEPHSGILRAAL